MSWDVPGTRSPTDLGLNAGKRKPLEPNRHLLLSSYQYFFIQPRSLLSHPKEHHCMQNDSNVKWTQYAAHVCCVCQCWCISSYTSTVLVVVLSHVTAVFFFFFSSSPWAGFACFLSDPFEQRMLLMIRFDTSLLYAGLNIIPSLLQGRDRWSGHLSSSQRFTSVEKHLSLVT